MKRSTERILTTHAGSLPRPPDLTRMMWDLIDGKPVDEAALRARVREAVAEVVRRQREVGIDIVSDGEMSKVGFSNYVMQRYSGFANRAQFVATDLGEFPDIINKLFVENEGGRHLVMPNVEGPIELRDAGAVERDIDNLKAALGGASPDDAFIAAVTPGQMLFNFPNLYYPSDEAYLEAAAKALAVEYAAIVEAGFNLQLDAPDLPMRAHCYTGGVGTADIKTYVPMAIEAMNEATRGLASRQGAAAPVLGQLCRPPPSRRRAQGHHRSGAQDQCRLHLFRGGQSASRARMGGVGAGPDSPMARS